MRKPIVILAALLSLLACDGPNLADEIEKANELKPYINVAMEKVRGFYVAALDGEDGASDLVAVGDDGVTTNVEVTEDGRGSATSIFDSAAFVFFRFDNVSYEGEACGTVGVRKSDGAMFCIPPGIEDCGFSCSWYYSPIQSDAAGKHIYALPHSSGLVKLALNSTDDSTMTEVTGREFMPNAFEVNTSGDALVSIPVRAHTETEFRLYKTEGGFAKVTSSKARSNCLFAGPGLGRENLYFLDGEEQNTFTRIVLVEKLAAGITTSTYADVTTIFTGMQPGTGNGACEGASRAQTLTSTFFKFFGETNRFIELTNPEVLPRIHAVTDFTNIDRIYGCDEAVILRGTDTTGGETFLRYTPATGTYDDLFTVGADYAISQVTVDSKCSLVFGGRRASDNARILGNVDPVTKKVSMIAESVDRDVTAVQMIR